MSVDVFPIINPFALLEFPVAKTLTVLPKVPARTLTTFLLASITSVRPISKLPEASKPP